MFLHNMLTLQEIAKPWSDLTKKEDNLRYICIMTDETRWLSDVQEHLSAIDDCHQTLVMGLTVQHTMDTRVDSIFIVCHCRDIQEDFLNEISKYIIPQKDEDVDILGFLKRKWEINPASYAITFLWTTRTCSHFTLIADRAVAPAYQRKGLMKNISLNFIDQLEEMYGGEHQIMSTPVHHATYLFFNPHDLICKEFRPDVLEMMTCSLIKNIHARDARSFMRLEFTPQGLQAWNKLKMFTSDEKTSDIISSHGKSLM